MPDTIMQPPPAAAPVKEKSQMLVVCENIQAMTPKFQAALPAHIPPEKFVRTVLTTIQLNPDIARCDPASIYNECIKAAADGLIIDGREAALVKYSVKKKVDGVDRYVDAAKYMPMVAGLLKKARNSGEISSVVGRCVYEKDKFHVVYGDDEKLTHEPCLDGEPGPVRLAYMVAKLKDGTIIRHVMTLTQINKRRAASKSSSGPWVSWFDEMAVKTVLRAGSKFLPASSDRADFGDLIERDDDLYDVDGSNPLAPTETGEQGQQADAPRQRRPRQARSAATVTSGAAPEPVDQGKETDLFEHVDAETGEVSMVTQEQLAAIALAKRAWQEEQQAAEARQAAAKAEHEKAARETKQATPTVASGDAGAIPAHLRRAPAAAPVSEANPPPPTDDDVI